jgi:small subunit ribosomal protein S1
VASVTDFGVFVRVEDDVEGLIHVSQLSTERVDKPSTLFKAGDSVEAEVIHVNPQERKIDLSIRALKKTEERQEIENYLKKEKEGGRFSFETILNEELKLDRDEAPQPSRKEKGGRS